MITLHPYISEVDAYHKLRRWDRWIFNKLEICERLGSGPCGPIGTWMPRGEYCIRPLINIGGMGGGGFRKRVIDADRGILHSPHGYCWTPWTDALREWRLYIDDECVQTQVTFKIVDGTEHMEINEDHKPLPEQLKDISRYMMVEWLGDTIIDVGPRHMVEEMSESVVDDYRGIDPEYEPPEYGTFGFQPYMRQEWDDDLQMFRLAEVKEWI